MKPRRLVACLLLTACGEAPAGTAPKRAEKDGPAPDMSRAVNAVTDADREAHDYPSVGVRAGGDAWLADIEWDGAADHVEVGSVNRENEPMRRIHSSSTRLLYTASAADAAGTLHVLFCEQEAGGWALREILGTGTGEHLEFSPPRTLRAAPGRSCVEPALATDEQGMLLATWVETGEGLALWAAAHGPSGWSAPVEVSGQRASNWSPSVCASAPGRFAIAWDAAVDGDYDVQLARVEVGADGAPRVLSRHRVTDSPRFEAHASVTAHADRLYVAYDVGPTGWGREGSVNKLDEALHAERTIEIVAVTGDEVALLALQPTASMKDALSRNCEQPRLVAEGTGSLVLAFRGLPLPRDFDDPDSPQFKANTATRNGGSGWRTSIWITFITRLDGAIWGLGDQQHTGIPETRGRCDAPAGVVRRPAGGVVVMASGDGRNADALVEVPFDAPGLPDFEPREGKAPRTWWQPITDKPTHVLTRMIKREPLVREIGLKPGRPLPAPREPVPPPPAPTRTVGGAPLRLALGDLHRHTDISRCSSNWDGSISDALRYAYDVAPLDFMAITDHFDHMTKYDWWRSVAQVDAWNAPGRMTTLRGYERADLSSGHRNVISAAEDLPLVGDFYGYSPARDAGRADTPADLWPQLAGHPVLTIPHTPAGMLPTKPEVLDWATFNPAFDRVVEVFQSYRGSSEAADAPRAIPDLVAERYVRPNLDLGMEFGLVAGSDHQTSGGAFTGAWIAEPSRAGVFDALWTRRTFAATARGSLWTEWAGVPMGGVAPAPQGPASFHVEVDGFTRAPTRIEVFVDGALAATFDLTSGRTSVAVDVPVEPPAQGTRYVYARVTLAGDELMWSSPVRLYVPGQWPAPDGPSGRDLGSRLGDVWKMASDPLREKMRARDPGR